MKSKLPRVAAIAGLSILTLSSAVFALNSGDSVISLNYLNQTYVPTVTAQGKNLTEQKLKEAYDTALRKLDEISVSATPGTGVIQSGDLRARALTQGDAVALPSGGMFVHYAGVVRVSHSGAVINVTTGAGVLAGSRLEQGNRYLVAENTTAELVVLSGSASLGYQGGYTLALSQETGHLFTDVTSEDWFNDAVAFVYGNNLFAGMGDGTFGPGADMNRAMVMTVFYHLAGDPQGELAAATAVFSDVAAGQWYAPYVSWGAEQGVTAGTGDGTFSPTAAVTQEQMVMLLYNFGRNYLGLALTGGRDLTGQPGADRISDWARAAMEWAAGQGILPEQAGGLEPGKNAARAEVAAMLQNFSKTYLSV